MTTLEITLSALLGPLGIALAALGRQALRNRKHARANAAMVERTDREADAQEHVADVAAQAAVTVEALRQVPQLIENVRELMTEKDECKEALRQSAADREACRGETASLREQLARMAEVSAATRASVHGEDTGVTDLRALAAEVRRTPTPPGGTPAQPSEPVHPDPHSALSGRREIPPPRRGKETDR